MHVLAVYALHARAQVSIGKCLRQVKHYLIVMVMIMASFAVGIHYLYTGYIPSVDSPTRMHSKIVIKSPTYFKSYVTCDSDACSNR